jgi:hypothetical protein
MEVQISLLGKDFATIRAGMGLLCSVYMNLLVLRQISPLQFHKQNYEMIFNMSYVAIREGGMYILNIDIQPWSI